MKTTEQGYVYILTNPSFKEDWVKIGKSARPVDIRSKELDNTAVPLPFEIFAPMKTCKYNEVEKLVHKTIDRLTDLRIRQNREFFNVAPQMALDILRDIAKAIDDAEVILYHENKPVLNEVTIEAKKREVKRSRFRFSMCGIKIGEPITFIPTGLEVKVASDDAIEYEGSTLSVLPEFGLRHPVGFRRPEFAKPLPMWTKSRRRLSSLPSSLQKP